MLLIREAKYEDSVHLAKLFNAIDNSGYMMFEPGERDMSVEQASKLISRFSSDERSLLLVSEINGELTGYIAVIGNEHIRNKHRAYIVLGVLPEYQAQGIATNLFESVFEWTKGQEIWRLELTVMATNEKAIRLYSKLGFKIDGERQASLVIKGKPTNEYYMYKLLNS